MANIQTIKAGRDWLQAINVNFGVLNPGDTQSVDLTFLNGWRKEVGEGNIQSTIWKTPLSGSSKSAYLMQISASKDLNPNESATLTKIPDGYKFDPMTYITNVPVYYGGHTGGFLQFFMVGNELVYHFYPNNGGVDSDANKTQPVALQFSLAWIA